MGLDNSVVCSSVPQSTEELLHGIDNMDTKIIELEKEIERLKTLLFHFTGKME